MKTVSTKLSKEDFEKFQEICNHDGKCISEGLRDLLKMDIEAYEEGLEIEKKPNESTKLTKKITNVTDTQKTISHGKILDDHGNVVAIL